MILKSTPVSVVYTHPECYTHKKCWKGKTHLCTPLTEAAYLECIEGSGHEDAGEYFMHSILNVTCHHFKGEVEKI